MQPNHFKKERVKKKQFAKSTPIDECETADVIIDRVMTTGQAGTMKPHINRKGQNCVSVNAVSDHTTFRAYGTRQCTM